MKEWAFMGHYQVLENPDLESALRSIRDALQRNRLILIFGECIIDYEGRSASKLGLGERLVVIKQDGAVLVHRPEGYSPVNWQPSTTTIDVWIRPNEGLSILAIRSRPRETLRILFTRIHLIIEALLQDEAEFIMYLDEGEIRDILFEKPELLEPGLRILEKEKRIGTGAVDLFGVDSKNNHVLIEIKRVMGDRDAVLQLYNYVVNYSKNSRNPVRGILIAPAFTPGALELLAKLELEYVEIDLKKMRQLIEGKKKKSDLTILRYLYMDDKDGERRT
ncbi:MAG: endonuclease NucS [Thermosphaera sp.]